MNIAKVLILLIFYSYVDSYCNKLMMGTHRHIPNIIDHGRVSTFYSPNTDASIYTPFNQNTDYFYIKFEGPKLTV